MVKRWTLVQANGQAKASMMRQLLDDLERFKDPALAAEEEDLAISSAATAYSGTHRLSFHSNQALIQIYIQPV